MISNHAGSRQTSLGNTRVIRKKPQTKLSYLKKLFAHNNDNQAAIKTLTNSKEASFNEGAYHASSLNNSSIANQVQSLKKQPNNYKCGYLYGHENAKKIDDVIQRYKQSNKSTQKNTQNQLLKQDQKNKENLSTHSFFYRKKNKIKQKQNKNNQSIIQKNKSIQQNYYKQLKKDKYENRNEGKNLEDKENRKNRSFYRISGKECQKNGCVEMGELIKIDKILKKIKREIKINRSVILNGFQQLKYINLSTIHHQNPKNPYQKNRYTNHYEPIPPSSPHQYRKHSNSQILKTKNHNPSNQNFTPKPSIIYNYSYKIK